MSAIIQTLKDKITSNIIYPVTKTKAVYDDDDNLLDDILSNKQPTLISGTNIKTVNGNSLLGSGNITIDGAKAFVATYGTTTASEIATAVSAGKAIFVNYTDGGVTNQLMLVDNSDSKYGFAKATVGTSGDITSVAGMTITLAKATNTWEVFSGSDSIPTKTSDLTNDGDGSNAFATEDEVIKGVQVAGTDLTIGSDRKVNVPVAPSNNSDMLGVCRGMSAWGVWSDSGTLKLFNNTSWIDSRANTGAIHNGNMDYAWKSAEAVAHPKKTTMDSVAVSNASYFLGEQSSVSITLPSSPSAGDTISVVFYSGSTATTLTVSGTYLGTLPTPTTSQRVELSFLYDNSNWCLLSNTMGVS